MKMVFRIIKVVGIVLVVVLLLVTLIFGHRDLSMETLKSKYAPAPSQFVEVAGMQVHYRDQGNPSDSLPLVLIHGTGASLHTFEAWTGELKKDRRVIRLDLPGYGLTGPFPDQNYALEHYVHFLHEFLKSIGIKRCILGGNSLGGQIAWQYTLAHSNQVDKLILIDAAGYPFSSQSVPLAFRMARTPILKELFTVITPRSVVQSSVENVYGDASKVTQELVDRYFDLSLRPGNRRAFIDRFAAKSDTTSYLKIPEITIPTLILWGQQDRLIPVENAYRFHRDLPNDTLVILNQSGHVPMEEHPEESLSAVFEFIRSGG